MKPHPAIVKDPIPNSIQGVHRTLLEAALLTFNKLGYGGTTIAEIARAAGMTKQRVTYHCSDADEILYELAELWAQTGQRVTLEHLAAGTFPSSLDKIVGMSDALFKWMESYPTIAALSPVLLQAVKNNEKIRQSLSDTFDTGIDRIAEFLSAATTVKQKKNSNIKDVAQGIHSIMVGMALYVIARDDYANIKKHQNSAQTTVRSFLSNYFAVASKR